MGEDEMFIMVDCGKYTNEIDIFVRNELKNKIDYLIVTHIHNDLLMVWYRRCHKTMTS